ncbi:MAG: tryptophan-rich sensory protein [Rhodobacteraceae bacterium]|nr:tryptophan-rich sensory protein [Paracoccaceae bacterium]
MRMKAILLFAAAVFFAVAPFLAPEFGGFQADLFPVPQDRPPVQPAGWAFGIWGVIYPWIVVHAAASLFTRDEDPAWDAPRWPMILSLWLGSAWLGAAAVNPLLATAMIWVMLAGALGGLALAPAERPLLARLPIGLYAGWLTAASCVSVGLALAGWGLTGPVLAAVVGLVLAVAIGLWVLLWLVREGPGRLSYGAALVWGLAGVAAANAGTAPLLMLAAIAGALLLAAAALWPLRPGAAT